MKTKFWIFCLSALAIVALSCNPSGNNADSEKTDSLEALKPKPIPEDAVFLSGLYATSVCSPISEFGPQMLFDSTDRPWTTMPGAGPDEGVMLYFNQLSNIGSMEVQFAQNEKLGNILALEVFINGASHGLLKPESNIFKDFKEPVSSIYLRVLETDGIHQNPEHKDSQRSSEYESYFYSTKSYQSKKPVGISEIVFMDKSGKRMNIMPLKALPGKVAASSTLEPEEAFCADFLFDSRYDFAWSEGNKETAGEGETVKFSFDQEQTITKIKIWSGFHRSLQHYNSNARVKSFEFGSPGNMVKYELKDEMKPFEISLQKPLKGKDFELKILEVYPGASYKDLVISELQFYTDWGWTVIATTGAEQKKNEFLGKLKGSVMEQVVDHWFYEDMKGVDDWSSDRLIKTSIILRSDRTFVIWTQDRPSEKDTYETKVVYDGNWELVSNSANNAKINIFGTRWSITQGFGVYKGMTMQDRAKIFSDVLTVSTDRIVGQKFIETIHLK